MAVLTAIAHRVADVNPSVVLAGLHQASVAESQAGYLRPPVVLSTTPSLLVRHRAEATATAAPSATATPAPTPEATATATPAPQPAFFAYAIQPGDSVDSIAARFGIDPRYIIWNNPEVKSDPDLLIIGASLLIPSTNGLVYNVVLGDTLSDIASYYKIDVQSITAFVPNRLPSADHVTEGMVLVLPGAVPPAPPPPPIPAAVNAIGGSGTAASVPSADPEPVSPARSGYIWPFYGAISQYFSGSHRGIDIDGFGHYGAPIAAAAGGTVVLAAYQDWGYGNHVIIAHADGSQTLYAHLSEISVSRGEHVSQGESVGALGTTGYSTGPHLHFEIHIGGGPVDPLAYLP